MPKTDALSQPVGGVRFPELGLPLGRLRPVSLPPVVTTSSGAVCGNSGGFEPFSAAAIARRHSRAAYLARYRRALTRLERHGYLRRADRAGLLAAAAADYRAARTRSRGMSQTTRTSAGPLSSAGASARSAAAAEIIQYAIG